MDGHVLPSTHEERHSTTERRGTCCAQSTRVVRKRIIALAVLATIVAAVAAYYRVTRTEPAPRFTTTILTRGDVIENVDATGTLAAVTTVQVGTQVSGTVKTLHADFNSRVRRGHVVAELESALFETQVEQARATVVRLEAESARAIVQLEDVEAKLRRARQVATQQLISDSDREAAEVNVREAEAAVKSADAQIAQAKASLNQAEVNLRTQSSPRPLMAW